MMISVSSKFSSTVSLKNEEKMKNYKIEGGIKVVSILNEGESSGSVMCLRYSSKGRFLAVGFKDGSIKVYGTKDFTKVCELNLSDNPKKFPVTGLKFLSMPFDDFDDDHMFACNDESGVLIASYALGKVAFWHFMSCSLLSVISEKRPSLETLNLAVSHENQYLASVGADPLVNLYDVASKKHVRTFQATDADLQGKGEGQRNRYFGVCFHPQDENIIVTGGWDRVMRIWDFRCKNSIRSMFGPYICGDAIDMSSDGNSILTASWKRDESLQIWDFASFDMFVISDQTFYKSMLYTGQWYSQDGILCGGSNQNMIRLIDKYTYNTIGSVMDLPHGVFCVDNSRKSLRPLFSFGCGSSIYNLKCTSTPKKPL